MPPLLMAPEALGAALADTAHPDIRLLIVDLCRDEIFARHHLPGAVHVSPGELVSGEKPAVGKLPPLSRLEDLLSRIGYDPDLHLVAYDDEGGGWAGRFIWTLEVIGHRSSSLLDGGLIAWMAKGLPVTGAISEPAPTRVSLQLHDHVIADKEDLLAAVRSGEAALWDARSPEEWAGARVVAARGGHVPGAINLEWLELMDRNNHLQLRADLAEYVAARGFDGGRPVITYCQTHHRSGLTWFAGRLLGLDIRAYPGSWSEWGNDPDTPIDNPSL